MKRILSVLLSLLLLLSCIPAGAVMVSAATMYGDLVYVIEDGEVTITGSNTDMMGFVEIPATIEGYPVTKIGDQAFGGCESLASVTLPEGITYIGDCAFINCYGLTEISIPSTVTEIHPWAFKDCQGLMAINVAEENTVFCSVDGVLYTESMNTLLCYPCSRSDEYIIPEGVEVIGEAAFYNNTGILFLTIPASLSAVGAWSFNAAFHLKVHYAGSESDRSFIAIGNENTCLEEACWYYGMSVESTVPGTAVYMDFEDGEQHFASSDYVGVAYNTGNLYLFWDATSRDWGNIYFYPALEPHTEYKLTFKAKANKSASLWFKILNDWSIETVQETVDLTTTWETYELYFNPGDFRTAVWLFQSPNVASDAATYCFDDIVVTEVGAESEEPSFDGYITNGDFETGDTEGWDLRYNTEISANAAYNGKFGLHLQGDGSWRILGTQSFDVEAGKTYVISMWIKTVSQSVNVLIRDPLFVGDLESKWVDNAEWTYVEFIVTPTDTDLLAINFRGSDSGYAESVYVDDVRVAYVVDETCDHVYDHNCDEDCNLCGEWREVAGHVYDTVCDAYCNECGAQRENIHRYDNACDEHCNACGAWRPTDGHVYDDDHDPDCNACGTLREVFAAGDIDGNGRITMRDLALLVRFINGWDVEIAFLSTADVNGDGKINIRDAGLLQQYLNGWDVTLV